MRPHVSTDRPVPEGRTLGTITIVETQGILAVHLDVDPILTMRVLAGLLHTVARDISSDEVTAAVNDITSRGN
jgi:hypothetical protein